MTTGIVYLIGAGPGDPELITVKGLRLLQTCDVVLYDNLIPDELIVLLPPAIERIYVGKRGGRHSMPQDEINQIMLDLARSGKRVARLKGSDPLVFGRGGEEAAFLKEHGIPFEMIPGVTAGVAAPAYGGIPITDRTKASYVIFATGHSAIGKQTPSVPWDKFAQFDNGTIVIYMGIAEIDRITSALLSAGKREDTPAAVIERGTYSTQRTVVTTLGKLASDIAEYRLQSPAIIVVGNVVDLRKTLDWFGGKHLSGVRIMVTRAADQAAGTYSALRDLGAEVLAYPTIATQAATDDNGWNSVGRIIDTGGWLVFTSENGVRYFMRAFLDRFGDSRRLHQFRIAAVGEGTARALGEWHLKSDFQPLKATVRDLASELCAKHDLRGVSVLRVRGNLGDDSFEKTASDAGALVTQVFVYETTHYRWPSDMKDKLFEHPPDAVIFTSSSTFTGLQSNLSGDELSQLLGRSAVFSIGSSTSAVIRSAGFSVTVESTTHTIPALIYAITRHFSTR